MADNALSVRLPKATREKLDRAAAKQRRSRSQVVIEALEKHLQDVDAPAEPPKRRYAKLLALGGAGRNEASPRSADEVIRDIRWLRGDD